MSHRGGIQTESSELKAQPHSVLPFLPLPWAVIPRWNLIIQLNCRFLCAWKGFLKTNKQQKATSPPLLCIIPTREPELYLSNAPGNWQLRWRLNKSSHSPLSKHLLIICPLKAALSAGVRGENETSASVLMGERDMVIKSVVTGPNGEAAGLWERVTK